MTRSDGRTPQKRTVEALDYRKGCIYTWESRGLILLSRGNRRCILSSVLEGKSVLLVDDDSDMLTALAAMLDETGADIRTAADGNEALEVAAAFDPDVVVLDAMLPKRSGFLVLEKLKAPHRKRGRRPYVVMITGNAGKRHQVWAESLGVDDYLNKPFRMERLLQSLEKITSNGGSKKETS